MSDSLFDFSDYRKYLAFRIHEARSIRGIQNLLAQAAGCHPSYLSTTLRGTTELTPDQAAGLAEFWRFREIETDFFLELVHYARAAGPRLKGIVKRRLQELRGRASDLGKKLEFESADPKAESFYYASWVPAAVHVALSVPALQTVSALAEHFGLAESYVESCLQQLAARGLVARHGAKWQVGPSQVHLSADSPYILSHHANWRAQATLDVMRRRERALHYSGVHSLSEETAGHLRRRWVDLLSEASQKIRDSREEKVFCLNLDWFEI